MRTRIASLSAIVSALVLCNVLDNSASAAEWPQFLGPDRTGISKETGLLTEWPNGGPKEVWRVKGGIGMSAVAVVSGTAVTMVQTDGRQRVVALDAKTGEGKWSTPVAPAYENQMGNGSRGTPAVVDGVVYSFSGEGVLTALQLKDGKELWSDDIVKRHRGKVADYGMACSPLVVGDLVLVTIGAPQATVAACDIKSGKTRWTAGQGAPAGYSSPAVLKIAGRNQLVVYNGAAVQGIDLSNGEVLWNHAYVTAYECNIATPLLVNGNVFISSGENHGSTLLKVSKNGSGFGTSIVWASTGGRSVLRNEWQTSMLIDGNLYGFDNIGSAGPVTNLVCVNAATGKQQWRKPRFGKGNLIAADGKLFMTLMSGEVVIATASADGYKELGRKEVLGPGSRQAPTLSNGLLYVRDNEEIVCLDVRAAR